MNRIYFISGLTLGLWLTGCQGAQVQNNQASFNAINPISAKPNVRFMCSKGKDPETQQSLPTTYALINDSKKAIIRWETDRFANAGWHRYKRCTEVASRLEKVYNSNTLNLITTGTINSQPVICTTAAAGGDCQDLLITLKPEDDGLGIVKELGEMLNGRVLETESQPDSQGQKIYMQVDVDRFAEIPTFQEE